MVRHQISHNMDFTAIDKTTAKPSGSSSGIGNRGHLQTGACLNITLKLV